MAHEETLGLFGDIGGSKVRIGVATTDLLIDYEELPTPQDPDELILTVGGLVHHFAERYSADMPTPAFGVGLPGPVRRGTDGTMVGPMSNIPGFEQPVNLAERLAADRRIHGLGIYVLNDATAATYQAARLPGLRTSDGSKPTTYLTHSTGIGGDTILEGQIVPGLAEYGKIPVAQPDGSYLTLEDLVSGNGIKARYGDGKRSAKEFGADPDAQWLWDTVGRDFGRAIAVLAPIIGMSDVVIGGGISRDRERYRQPLADEMAKALAALPPGVVETPQISYVPMGKIDDIGLLGAHQAVQSHRDELEYV